MSLAWSAAQVEWLREMGFDVLVRRDSGAVPAAVPTPPSTDRGDVAAGLPPSFARAARGVDLAALLGEGLPRDPAARRALWHALRPLRRAVRAR